MAEEAENLPEVLNNKGLLYKVGKTESWMTPAQVAAKRRKTSVRDKMKRLLKNDIEHLSPVAAPAIRKATDESLECFMLEYFEHLFFNPFGTVQKQAIAQEQFIIEKGGRLNKLEPRGYAKTTRSAVAALWAVLTGRHEFVLLCCDSLEKASDLLKLIRDAVTFNSKLLDNYPILECFNLIGSNVARARFQTFEGTSTEIQLNTDTIVFPRLNGKYPSEGAIIAARPFRKARGKNIKGVRPSLIILDDVQTSDDAMSGTAIRKLMKILTSDIAYLGSRDRPVDIINNATIIEDGDYPTKVAELDAFTTVRYKMVETMPINSLLWEKYQEIRKDYDRGVVGDRTRASNLALEFYKQNREAMDEGSVVTWDHAFSFDRNQEISTIQAAMNFIADFGVDSFQSECQNEPVAANTEDEFLTDTQILEKQNGLPQGIVPASASKLVGFIDVQKEMCFWNVWAFDPNFTAYCIDYGTFPDQKIPYFEKNHLRVPLSKFPGYTTSTLEARLKKMLINVSASLLEHEFYGEDGLPRKIDRIGWDTGYQTDTVRSAWRESKQKERITLCMGYGYGAKRRPMRFKSLKKHAGEQKGHGWFYGAAKAGIRTMEIDTNMMKSFCHQRYATDIHDPGSYSLFKETKPKQHSLYSNHMCAEYRTPVEGPYGRVDEWSVKPGYPDNDWFDCLVGTTVMASFEGIEMTGADHVEKDGASRKKVNASKWGAKR